MKETWKEKQKQRTQDTTKEKQPTKEKNKS